MIRPKDTLMIEKHKEYLDLIEAMPKVKKNNKNSPNIICILMDDMGWGDLSCFGSKAIKTPNLDRLANEGIAMTQCYSSNPICSPSRYGLLTGRYPSRGFMEKVFFPTCEIEDKYITLRGYEIAEEEKNGKPSPFLLKNAKVLPKKIASTLPVKGIMEDEVTIAEILKARGYKTGIFGKWHLGDKSPHLPNDKGFDYFFGAHYSNDMYPYHFWKNKEIAIEAPFDQRKITEYLNEELFMFIRKNKNNPFFAYYPSPWPHHPVSAGERFANTSKAGVYGDCIEEFDSGIGEMIKLLEEQNILEDTLIIFTSDNGPWHQGSPGFHRGRKGVAFDGGQVVPTIIYWKDKFINEVIEAQAMNIDFFPTICEITKTPLPQDRIIDGKSLLQLLTGTTKESPHDYLIYVDSTFSKEQGYGVRSKDNFKYYKQANSENSAYAQMRIHPFLFNLNYDINESYNVKNMFPQKYQELKKILDNYNEQINENPRGWV